MHIHCSSSSSSRFVATAARNLAALRAVAGAVAPVPLGVNFVQAPIVSGEDNALCSLLPTALPTCLVALEGVTIQHEVRCARCLRSSEELPCIRVCLPPPQRTDSELGRPPPLFEHSTCFQRLCSTKHIG